MYTPNNRTRWGALHLLLLSLVLVMATIALTNAEEGQLVAARTNAPPVVDGLADAMWSNVPALAIQLGETYDVHDPASVTDCAGCHRFDSDVSVTLKSAYTRDRIYMLATWLDSTASFTRGGSWTFRDGSWQKLNPEQSEDRIALYWPMGPTKGNPYDTGGCMAKCHMYYPTDTDPHVSEHGIVDDAWLEEGRGDIWHSKAARGGALIAASGANLTIDPATHEVTQGMFSMQGYIDDKYAGQWSADNSEDGGRYGDAGSSAYSHNRIGDKSRPKYIETAPADYADAMFLTQAEIDAGECAGDPDAGVTDADAAAYWPAYSALEAVVPERILRQPTGSRADITFAAQWQDGVWTAEFARALNTGTDDDIQFDTSQQYLFEVAAFENSRHGYEHRVSAPNTLVFAESVATAVEGEQIARPTAVSLGVNYPNPFNPETTITFDLPQDASVTLSVFSIAGQKVATLVSGNLAAGRHSVAWDARALASGPYICRLEAGTVTRSRWMMLLK